MKQDELEVASAMSNMEYRSIQEIADIAKLPWISTLRIVRSFISRGFVESKLQGFVTYYRLT